MNNGLTTVRPRAVVVAQLVERLLPKAEVLGSNPVIGKNLFIYWTFVYCQLCIEKTKIKKKRPGMAHKKTTVRPYFYDPSLKLSRCAKAEIFYWLLWQKSFTQSSICFCFYCRLQKQASQGRSFSSTKMKKDIPQKSGGKNGRIWSRHKWQIFN